MQTGSGDKPNKPAKPKTVRRKRPVVKAPAGDVASSGGDYGLHEADRAKRTNKKVRRDTQATYDAQPTRKKQAIVKNATGETAHQLRKVHKQRVARNSEIEQSAAGKDTKSDADRRRAAKYKQTDAYLRDLKVAADARPKAAPKGPGLHVDLASRNTKVPPVRSQPDRPRTDAEMRMFLATGKKPIRRGTSESLKAENQAMPVQFLRSAAKDYVDINANAIPSMAKLAKDVVTDPKKAAKEVAQPYKDFAKHPVKSFVEHPVGTYLLFGGPVKGVDRAVGKGLRSVPSEKVRKIASTERSPKTVPGTDLKEHQSYGKGVVHKAAQVVTEKVQEKHAGQKPKLMSSEDIKRRVDEHVAASEDIRRAHRAEAVDTAHRAITNTEKPKGSVKARARTVVKNRREKIKPTAATVVAAQNIARPGEDLAVYANDLKAAGANLTHARKSQNKATVKQLAKANKKADPVAVEAAASKYKKLSVAQQEGLAKRGLVSRDQAEKARLIPYAVRYMGAKHDPKQGIVDKHSQPLSSETIREHMHAHGVDEPAFVTQAPNQRGAKNFFVPTHEAPQVSGSARTGAAVRQGTVDYHPDTLVEQSAKSQGLMDAADRYAAFVKEFGHRSKSGKVQAYATFKQAQQAARDAGFDHHGEMLEHAVPMRPVRLNPFLGKQKQLEELLNSANAGHEAALGHVHETVHQALEGGGGGDHGAWALVPDAAARRMQEHIKTLGPSPAGRVANLYGSIFRRNVLAFSPKWLTGNIVEAALRSTLSHAGPRSYVTGRNVLKRLDQQDAAAGLEARVRTSAGGHYSLATRNSVTTTAEHFAGTKLAGVATALGKLTRTPGPKQLVGLYHAYTDFVFNTLNGRIETQFQTAMLGKALRDSPLMSEHVVKLSAKALDDAAKGLKDTNAQVALGREVDRMYGKYGKFTPQQRRFISAYTPFLAWTLNATKFLTSVLPKDHPVVAALLASASLTTEEWRKQQGRYFDPFGEVQGMAPDFLQGTIQGKDNSYLNVQRFTPFSLASGGVEGLGDLVLPQWRDVLNAFQGQDWKGQPLNGAHGVAPSQAQRLTAAATALIETGVPGLSLAQASAGGGLRSRVDPFAYHQPKKKGGGPEIVEEPRSSRSPGSVPALPPLPSLPSLPSVP